MAATKPSSAEQALARLIAGNERFLKGESRLPGLAQETLKGLVDSQQPFAAILGCSDSRVPPEIVFDSGLGELFVIRVAGNVFSPEVAASLQFAGAQLHTPLFVVLGHQGCGAVNAALQSRDEGERHRSRIQLLVDNILPGLPQPDPQLSREEQANQAVESNVLWTIKQISDTSEAKSILAEQQIQLIGAVYEIATGQVRYLRS